MLSSMEAQKCNFRKCNFRKCNFRISIFPIWLIDWLIDSMTMRQWPCGDTILLSTTMWYVVYCHSWFHSTVIVLSSPFPLLTWLTIIFLIFLLQLRSFKNYRKFLIYSKKYCTSNANPQHPRYNTREQSKITFIAHNHVSCITHDKISC
jgi:hypothetical protein